MRPILHVVFKEGPDCRFSAIEFDRIKRNINELFGNDYSILYTAEVLLEITTKDPKTDILRLEINTKCFDEDNMDIGDILEKIEEYARKRKED